MYWKKLGPHIEEFIVFLTIVIGLNLFFLCTDAIRINWSTTVVLFVILLSIWLIGYVFRFNNEKLHYRIGPFFGAIYF